MREMVAKNPVIRSLKRSARSSVDRLMDRMSISRLESSNHFRKQNFVNVLEKCNKANRNAAHHSTQKIEEIRRRLLQREDPIDDGTLDGSGIYDEGVTVRGACSASKPPKSALFLYYLVQEFQPRNAIELGTNVGISSAYIASALNHGRLTTFEASPYRIRLAKEVHAETGIQNVTYVPGLFADTLENTLQTMDPIDFAFIDGHHQYQPTLDYFHISRKYATNEALFVFDDIQWSDGMKQAWSEIKADPCVTLSMDLQNIGVCIVEREPSSKTNASIQLRTFL